MPLEPGFGIELTMLVQLNADGTMYMLITITVLNRPTVASGVRKLL